MQRDRSRKKLAAALAGAAAACLLFAGCAAPLELLGSGARTLVRSTSGNLVRRLFSTQTPAAPAETPQPDTAAPVPSPAVQGGSAQPDGRVYPLAPAGLPGSYQYQYTDSCGEDSLTTFTLAPDGTGTLRMESEHLLCPIELGLTAENAAALTALLNEDALAALPQTGIRGQGGVLTVALLAQGGAVREYTMYASTGETSDFWEAVNALYDTFGAWQFTEAQPDAKPVADFMLVEETGHTAIVYNLANERADYSVKDSLLESEQIEIDANHMQYRFYQDGSSGTYALMGLSNADMMVLESLLARHDVWNWDFREDGSEYVPDYNADDSTHYLYLYVQAEGEEGRILQISGEAPAGYADFLAEVVDVYNPF